MDPRENQRLRHRQNELVHQQSSQIAGEVLNRSNQAQGAGGMQLGKQDSELNPFEQVDNENEHRQLNAFGSDASGLRVFRQGNRQKQATESGKNGMRSGQAVREDAERNVHLMQSSLSPEILQLNPVDDFSQMQKDGDYGEFLGGSRQDRTGNRYGVTNQHNISGIVYSNSREDTRLGGPGAITPLLENSRNQDHDPKNFFIKSEKGDEQSINDQISDEASRAGENYPSITLGKFRQSSHPRRNPPQQVQIPQNNSSNHSQNNSHRDEKIATFSRDALNRLVYDLLQKIGLVKYLTEQARKSSDNGGVHQGASNSGGGFSLHGPNSDQAWLKAGQKVLETIKKHSEKFKVGSPMLRQQHNLQIESTQIRQIFNMLNNFAMHYLQVGKMRECSQILHLAWQIDKNYQQSFTQSPDGPKLQSMFYSNFSTYHLILEQQSSQNGNSGNPKNSGNFNQNNHEVNSARSRSECQDMQLAKKYIHAATQLSVAEIHKENTARVANLGGQGAEAQQMTENPRSGLKKQEIRRIFLEMNCAINYNNRAVIQLKNGCYDASKVHSCKAIQLLEPTVFYFISNNIVSQVQQSHQSFDSQNQKSHNGANKHKENTQNSNHNLASLSSSFRKHKEESVFQEILSVLLVSYFNYAMSMDRDLKSRDIYLRGMQLIYQYVPNCQSNILFRKFQQKYCRKMYDQLEKELENTKDFSTIDLREPLPEILPLDMRSVPDNQSVTGNAFQENRVMLNRRPVEGTLLNNAKSFTIFSESQSNLNGHPGGVPDRRSFLKQDESACSMPTIFQGPVNNSLTQVQKKNLRERCRADAEPAAEQLGLHSINQKSSVMNDNSQLQPVQPNQQWSQGFGRPSKNLASFENLKVKADFMNISNKYSRGGDDRAPVTEGPSILNSDRKYVDETLMNDITQQIVPQINDEDELRLRVQRTFNSPGNSTMLPADGRAKEFNQRLPFDVASSANEPNQFVPSEKIDLKLKLHPKSQISNPNKSQSQITDSINNRADDSSSNLTGLNYQLALPRASELFPTPENTQNNIVKEMTNHTSPAAKKQNQDSIQNIRDNDVIALQSQQSNESPALRFERTAKFGNCRTGSMSNSVSPGIQSRHEAVKSGDPQQTPRGQQNQSDQITNFSRQDPNTFQFPRVVIQDQATNSGNQGPAPIPAIETLQTPKKSSRHNSRGPQGPPPPPAETLTLPKQTPGTQADHNSSQELALAYQRMQEEKEAFKRQLQEEHQRQMELEREAMRKQFEEIEREKERMRQQKEERDSAVPLGRYGQQNNGNGLSEVSSVAEQTNLRSGGASSGQGQGDKGVGEIQRVEDKMGKNDMQNQANQEQVEQAKKPIVNAKMASNLSNPRSQSTPNSGPQTDQNHKQDLSSMSPRTPENTTWEQFKGFEINNSDKNVMEKEEATGQEGNESLQQSILKKQIKAMDNNQVDVFMTTSSVRFQSSKKNQQEQNQNQNKVAVPKINFGNGMQNNWTDSNVNEQPKAPLKAAVNFNEFAKGKNVVSPPLNISNVNPVIGSQNSNNQINSRQVIPDKQPFSYQRITDQDEKEAGFVNLTIQQKNQGFGLNDVKPQIQVEQIDNATSAQFAVENLQKLIQDFRLMQDQGAIGSASSPQRQQDTQNIHQLFNINQQQIDALIYLREHNLLYSPHSLWKFNKKMVDQIVSQKQIVCSKIISMSDGPQMTQCPIKVQIEVLYTGTDDAIQFDYMQQPNGAQDNSGMLYYHSLMKDSIVIRMSAMRLKQDLKSQPAIISQEFSLLELQSTMFFFEGIQLVDPSFAHLQTSSSPFFSIDTFQDLCELVLFHYVQITGFGMSESNLGGQSIRSQQDPDSSINQNQQDAGVQVLQSARSEQMTVDFSEEPNGILSEPLRIKFLMEDHLQGGDRPPDRAFAASDDDLTSSFNSKLKQLTQNDNILGDDQTGTEQDRQNLRISAVLGSFIESLPGHRSYNCTVNFFQVQGLRYKMLVTPTFDSQTMLFIQILRSHKNQKGQMEASVEQRVKYLLDSLEALQKVQPKNIGSLQIDIEFKDKSTADEVFKKYTFTNNQFEDNDQNAERVNPSEPDNGSQSLESPQQIDNGKDFFDKYFKDIIQSLDDYLLTYYADWFDLFTQDLAQPNLESSSQNPMPDAKDDSSLTDGQKYLKQIEEQLGNESQLIEEHKRHKRLFNLIVYMQIVSIRLNVGQKRAGAGGKHHMEMIIVHKSFDKKMLENSNSTGSEALALSNQASSAVNSMTHNVGQNTIQKQKTLLQIQASQQTLTAVCLLTSPDSGKIEKSVSIQFKSEKLLSLFSEQGLCYDFVDKQLMAQQVIPAEQQTGKEIKSWSKSVKDSLATHYLMQSVCRVYMQGMQILFEDPDASESECNLSNSSESIDESGDLDSNSDASNSQKEDKVAKPKLACIKTDFMEVMCQRRVIKLFQSQLSDSKYAAPVTCELLAWKRNGRLTRYIGVRISLCNLGSVGCSIDEEAILLVVGDDKRIQPSPQRRGPTLEVLMKKAGFDYIIENCIEFQTQVSASNAALPFAENLHLLLKHDKLDFPDLTTDTSCNQPVLNHLGSSTGLTGPNPGTLSNQPSMTSPTSPLILPSTPLVSSSSGIQQQQRATGKAGAGALGRDGQGVGLVVAQFEKFIDIEWLLKQGEQA